MAIATSKQPKASAVKQASIAHTSTFIQSLPEKPKEDLSLKEAINQMQDSIRGALAKGYTYQELAALLSEKGIKISAFTLKNYVPSGKRKAKEMAEKSTRERKTAAKKSGNEATVEQTPSGRQANRADGSKSTKSASTARSASTRGRRKTSA